MAIYIDYNAEMDGRFVARSDRLGRRLTQGEVVQSHDEDGNRVVLTVDEVDDAAGVVYLRPDWSTWLDADSARAVISGPVRLDRGLTQVQPAVKDGVWLRGLAVLISAVSIRQVEPSSSIWVRAPLAASA